MPHIVIDGNTYEAVAGKTIIETAYDNGLEIPHFCWHPELSVSGNCRMCLVEVGMPKRLPNGAFETDESGKSIINYFPKLQIACATPVTDGMHVRTKTEIVKNAQEAVMEFLLINHPLDCPICDEAGQCKLQEYAFRHSRGESRLDDMKNRKDKRQAWSPNIMFDAERCITCSRCIRFTKEIGKQDVLTFVQRGDHVTIKLFEGTELDNAYSMNIIDICPVGALTSTDFRFKSRVWDMSFNESICPGCSRGCNIQIGVRNNEILRLEPKANPFVNKFWMCDYGRLTQYQKVNLNRILKPFVKQNGHKKEVSWDEAVQTAYEKLKPYKGNEIMFLGSAFSTNEDNYVLKQFVQNIFKSENIDFLRYRDDIFADDFLKTNDRTPNSKGAELMGIIPGKHAVDLKSLEDKIKFEDIKVLYTIDDDFSNNPELLSMFENLELLIVHGRNHNELTEMADICFAASTYAEIEGTWINCEDRVQHLKPALVTSENLRFMGMKMSRLDKFGAFNDKWTQHELRNTKQDWKILQLLANKFNAGWGYKNSEEIFDKIATKFEGLKGMSYELLDEYRGLKLFKAANPEKKELIYESHRMKPN